MEDIKRCSRCLLPETLVNLSFDEEGVCNYCRDYERDFADWDEIKERKKKEFEEILLKAKNLKRSYDCLIPLSGGKDSTYALYLTSKVYKLKTLAVTLDNGYLTNPAKENINNALKNCDADHIYYTINRNNSLALFKAFWEQTGDFCNGCMRGINYAIEISLKSFNIPLVIKGSGRRVQYISQLKGVAVLNTPSYFDNVMKRSSEYQRFKYLAKYKNKLEFQKIVGGIADVLGLSRLSLMRYFPQHIGMYDYIYLPFTEIVDILKKEMGWSDSSQAVEHLDCELHNIPFFRNTLLIPNISKHTLHSSGLIRQGILSRDEALKKEKEDLADDRIPPELEKFLSDIGVSYEEYVEKVKNSDRSQFEPKLQRKAREIYHRFRKF